MIDVYALIVAGVVYALLATIVIVLPGLMVSGLIYLWDNRPARIPRAYQREEFMVQIRGLAQMFLTLDRDARRLHLGELQWRDRAIHKLVKDELKRIRESVR